MSDPTVKEEGINEIASDYMLSDLLVPVALDVRTIRTRSAYSAATSTT